MAELPFDKLWRDWLKWQCFLPLVFVLATYLIAKHVAEVPHPVEVAYADGSLLLYSALLLIGVRIEFRRLLLGEEPPSIDGSLMVAMFLLFTFGVLRTDMISHNYFGLTDVPEKVGMYARLNLAVTACAVPYAMRTFWKARQLILYSRA